MTKKKYDLIKTLPVAKFYYQGTKHTHPVRRTVLLIESDNTTITGYEIREGNKVRSPKKAPIKSYTRSCIATYDSYCRLRDICESKKNMTKSTLRRFSLDSVKTSGI